MNLQMTVPFDCAFTSPSQVARVVTEGWVSRELYCAACSSPRVEPLPCNNRATDFTCGSCHAPYQLKSGRRWSDKRVPDAAYSAMVEAVRTDRTPNLLILQYDTSLRMRNLLLIPSFFFNETAIEKRAPLSVTARRAGWVGCNIRLDAIAPAGKLHIVNDGTAAAAEVVRHRYAAVRPLSSIPMEVRGWTLDVMRAVHDLRKREFTLRELYTAAGPRLAGMRPDNHHVQAKIRQQLQVLRDLNLLIFLGRGRYKLTQSVP